MFEYKAPTFAPGPLRKEILMCLRDIALGEQSVRYFDYSDGVITGCELYEENMQIGVLCGIVKFGGRLYQLRERAGIPYEPTDDWTVLKIQFGPQVPDREYTHYTARLVLDVNTELGHGEMEMGRFKLKQGSRLRTKYKDFWDMGTEYDTVNLLGVRQAAKGEDTISPVITTHFAREAYAHVAQNPLDAAFCTRCLSGEAVPRELIQRYICTRDGGDYREMDNHTIHRELAQLLDAMTGRDHRGEGSGAQEGVLLFD